MAGYNRTRYVEELLEKTDALPPSFSVHLHPEYWTLNNGSKFLYNNQIASLLDDIRAHQIPVDFLELFEAARVPFYDGCMIVELLDYRPQRNKEPTLDKPERTRAVLHPNSETLWADICSLNKKYGGKWSDEDALKLEARLLLAISPPLCLDPNPHLTRVANHVMRVSTPTVPVSLKRKAAAMDPEEDETDKARRAKIMQFMNPRHNMTYTPSYRLLDVLQLSRQPKSGTPHPPINSTQYITNSQISSPTKPSTPSETSADLDEQKTKSKKGDTPQTSFATNAFVRANGTHTPVTGPVTAIHQFISQNSTSMNPSPPPGTSPMQPQVYPNVRAATEAAMRTPTPAQQHYAPPSRPPSSQPPASSHPTPQPQPLHLAPVPQLQLQPQPQPMYIHNQPFATSPLAGTRHGSVSPTKAGNNLNSNVNPVEPAPNPINIPHHANSQQAAAQAMYSQQMQHLQLVQVMAQRLSGNNAGSGDRSTPTHSHTHTPMQSQSQLQLQGQAPSPARSSPRATSKALGVAGGARASPLPPNAQLPAPHPQQAPLSQLSQHLQQQQQLALAAQYNLHLRPGMHTGPGPSPHPQAMSPHMENAKGSGNGIRRTGTASPLLPASDGPQQLQTQPQLHLQQQAQPQQLHHGYPAHMYGYAQNFAHAQAQAQAQGRAAGYWPIGMGGRPGMVGVGVAGQGIMGPGQPSVIGPGKAGAGVSGR